MADDQATTGADGDTGMDAGGGPARSGDQERTSGADGERAGQRARLQRLESEGENLVGLRMPTRRQAASYLVGFVRRVLIPQAVIIALFSIPVRGSFKIAPEYILPVELALLIIYLSVFAVLLNFELRQVAASDSRVRWVESLMVLASFFIALFARLYTILGAEVPQSFSEPMGTLNGFYYAVTVFSTVGFGDITPETSAAKLITMTQMLLGLGLIGLLVRVLTAVARKPTTA